MATPMQHAGPLAASAPASVCDSAAEFIDAVHAAVAANAPLAIRGGNTKAWYGHRATGTPLDVRSHAGVVEYEPSELVVVARAGTPLCDLETLLAEHRQMLAFEPPRFGTATIDGPARAAGGDAIARATHAAPRGADPGSTVGGCIASGLSGPRRMAAGAARDFVLGAKLIDGRGQHLAFGGKVMKNVAGYDVSRALVGSLGTLGIVTEVALKVLPMPEETATLSFALDEQVALDQVNRWAGQSIAITASAWRSRPSNGDGYSGRGGRLLVRLEGSEAAVQSGIRRIGGLDVEAGEAAAYWNDLREETEAFFASRPADAPLWRLALPPTAAPLDPALLGFDDQLIAWGGALRWIATRVDPERVRDAVAALGGHATLWRASDELKARHGVFAPLAPTLMAIHRRLKNAFDPAGVFNRGRLYPEL